MGKTLISGLGKGVGGSWPRCRLAAKFLKIEFIFSFIFTNIQKIQKNLKINYILAARRDPAFIYGLCFVHN
jgi:hypothetical protein